MKIKENYVKKEEFGIFFKSYYIMFQLIKNGNIFWYVSVLKKKRRRNEILRFFNYHH